jgi:hypothetical protein
MAAKPRAKPVDVHVGKTGQDELAISLDDLSS